MRKVTISDFCDALNNYFERDVCCGDFVIENGSIDLPFLREGQYFRIVGSVLNDGIYRYPCVGLTDEPFRGEVWAMGIPPAVIALLADINEWQKKYGESSTSVFQSESMPTYSYTKATDSVTGGAVTWQTAFRDKMSRWRKI